MDYLIEKLRKDLGLSEEQEKAMIEEMRKDNPVTQLQEENDQLKKRVEASEGALLALMDIMMGGM